MKTFKCVDCKQEKPIQTDGGTGYALFGKSKRKVCYECCAIRDRKEMDKTGKAVLYLSMIPDTDYYVSNWPGTLKLPIHAMSKGRHNIAGVRYDVWFRFSGCNWHGIQYGDNTQICHCKRLKN